MKITLRMFALLFLGLSVMFFIGCEDDDATDDAHPLVGTWTLSNMDQSSTYYADTDAYTAYGITNGMTLGQGSMDWTAFSALGVSATVVLNEDNTFTLTGNFPVANEVLGLAPNIVPLTDNGTWTAADDLSTLLIDGSIYDLGGALTLDDADNPTVISMAYSETATPDTVTLMIDADQDGTPETPLAGFPITEDATTVLGFTLAD